MFPRVERGSQKRKELAVLYENRLLSFLIMQQYTDNSLFNRTRGEILAIRFSVDRIGGWEIEKLWNKYFGVLFMWWTT